MFYPLIPLIAQFFNIVGEIDYAFGHVNRFWMLYASYIGTSIQGFLITLLFFTIDPAVIELRRSMYRHFFSKHESSGEEFSYTRPRDSITHYV